MIRSLFWKEWVEQGWRIAFACVVLAAFPAIGLTARMPPDEVVFGFTCLLGGFILPLLVAMGLVAPERSEGSLRTLLALPIPAWKTLLVKLVVGALGCVLPLLSALIVTLLIAGGREHETSLIIKLHVGSALVGVFLVIWVLAFSIGQPTEARVGLIGLACLGAWTLGVMISEGLSSHHELDWLLFDTTPASIADAILDEPHQLLTRQLAIQLCIAALMLIWTAHRFGRPGRARS